MNKPAVVLAFVMLSLSACSRPSTIVTPAGQVAFTKDQIVVRINELENVAIQAAGTGGLPMPTAKIIVKFCVGGDQIIQASASGWQAALAQAWATAKPLIPPTTNAAVVAAISAVDVALATLGGN